MKTITLSEKVVVSDPCYSLGTWCQTVIDNLLAGEYFVEVTKRKYADWGRRNIILSIGHKDHYNKLKIWKKIGNIGVDSGQAGIFSFDSYRKDSIFKKKSKFNKEAPFDLENSEGDEWYGHMCDKTLSRYGYGTYKNGVVSSSGMGDGSYPVFVSTVGDKVVGILIDFDFNVK
jgi:hypothetical protein